MTGSGQSPADSVRIEQNLETGHWDAVERPTPNCMIVTHAPSLAELHMKLNVDTGEAG